MNPQSLEWWRSWLSENAADIDTPQHVDDAVIEEFRVHNTLLHRAVLGHWYSADWPSPESLVELLLDHGANPNLQNDHGKTPLHLACELDTLSLENAQLLLAGGADSSIRTNQGERPIDLLFGSKRESLQIRQLLTDDASDE